MKLEDIYKIQQTRKVKEEAPMLMRTAYDINKEVENGDFVVLVSGGARQTLLAGVIHWKHPNEIKGVWYYKDGKLTETAVLDSDLYSGVIVGTEGHTFPLRDRIIKAIKENEN